MDWEVQPEGLTRLLVRLAAGVRRAGRHALYVTENGAAYDDEAIDDGFVDDAERTAFLRAHLGAILDAIEAGVTCAATSTGRFLDNFEWAWGYDKRFGIVRVDYDTQERTLKDSALEYARIIATRRLPAPWAGLDAADGDDPAVECTA